MKYVEVGEAIRGRRERCSWRRSFFPQREGRLIIAYSPLGQGLLSGKYQKSPPRNFRRARRAFSDASRRRLQPLVDGRITSVR